MPSVGNCRKSRYNRNMVAEQTKLAEWLTRLYGPGTQFHSARQLALAAGLNDSTLSRIIERGSASPDSLIAIARAVGEEPLQLLVMAGWLTEAEVSKKLNKRETDLLHRFRHMRPKFKDLLIGVAEGFATSSGQGSDA